MSTKDTPVWQRQHCYKHWSQMGQCSRSLSPELLRPGVKTRTVILFRSSREGNSPFSALVIYLHTLVAVTLFVCFCSVRSLDKNSSAPSRSYLNKGTLSPSKAHLQALGSDLSRVGGEATKTKSLLQLQTGKLLLNKR